jgi:hypothetical protein
MRVEVQRVDGVRVLSIKQPWAWAVVRGAKRVENRRWRTTHRGPVLIHASAGISGQAEFDRLRSTFRLTAPDRVDIERGCIVGVVYLVDVVTRKNAKRYGKWFTGKYGWVFTDAIALRKPVKLKSQLGLYRPTPGLLARVNAQLPARRRIRAEGR